jgi:cell division septation protein DedD
VPAPVAAPAPVVVSAPQVLKLPPAVPAPQAVAAQPKPTLTPPTPKPIVAAPAPAPAPSSGGVYVQLGALRSTAEAERLWSQLREAHPDLLGSASRSVEAVTVAGTGTLYRLRARGFASRATALSTCSSLKNRGQDCLVAQ